MNNILVRRYSDESNQSWAGWIEDEDRTWIAFIDNEGKPTFYLNRDPNTGAVI